MNPALLASEGSSNFWDKALPECLLAAAIAACLTLFDLDDVFYVPKSKIGTLWARFTRWLSLSCWWWGFILANGVLAAALYALLKDEVFKGTNPLIAASAAGLGYLAMARLKIATINEVPIGFEFFYERSKKYVYKRINKITTHTRQAELREMAASKTVEQLVEDVYLALQTDALLSGEDHREIRKWMLGILEDKTIAENEKKLYLGNFLLSGTRHSNPLN